MMDRGYPCFLRVIFVLNRRHWGSQTGHPTTHFFSAID